MYLDHFKEYYSSCFLYCNYAIFNFPQSLWLLLSDTPNCSQSKIIFLCLQQGLLIPAWVSRCKNNSTDFLKNCIFWFFLPLFIKWECVKRHVYKKLILLPSIVCCFSKIDFKERGLEKKITSGAWGRSGWILPFYEWHPFWTAIQLIF